MKTKCKSKTKQANNWRFFILIYETENFFISAFLNLQVWEQCKMFDNREKSSNPIPGNAPNNWKHGHNR